MQYSKFQKTPGNQQKIKSCQLPINFMRQYMKVQLFHVRAVTKCTILQLLKLMIFKIHGGQFYLLYFHHKILQVCFVTGASNA